MSWNLAGSTADVVKQGDSLSKMDGLPSNEMHYPPPGTDWGVETALPWNETWAAQRVVALPQSSINQQLQLLHQQEQCMRQLHYKQGHDVLTAELLPYRVIIPNGYSASGQGKVFLVLSIQSGTLSYGRESKSATIKLDGWELAFPCKIVGKQWGWSGYSIQRLFQWLTYNGSISGSIDPGHSSFGLSAESKKRTKQEWDNSEEGSGKAVDLANFIIRFCSYNARLGTCFGHTFDFDRAAMGNGSCVVLLLSVGWALQMKKDAPGANQNVLLWAESIDAKDVYTIYTGFYKAFASRFIKDHDTPLYVEKHPPRSNHLNGPLASHLERLIVGTKNLSNNTSIDIYFAQERGFSWSAEYDDDGNITVMAWKDIKVLGTDFALPLTSDYETALKTAGLTGIWRRPLGRIYNQTKLRFTNTSGMFTAEYSGWITYTWGSYSGKERASSTADIKCYNIRSVWSNPKTEASFTKGSNGAADIKEIKKPETPWSYTPDFEQNRDVANQVSASIEKVTKAMREKDIWASLDPLKEITTSKFPPPVDIQASRKWLDQSGISAKNDDLASLKDNQQSIFLRLDSIKPALYVKMAGPKMTHENHAVDDEPEPDAKDDQDTTPEPLKESGIKVQKTDCKLDWQFIPPEKLAPNAKTSLQVNIQGTLAEPTYFRYLEIQFRTKVRNCQLFVPEKKPDGSVDITSEIIKASASKTTNTPGNPDLTALKVLIKDLRGLGYAVHVTPPDDSSNGIISLNKTGQIAIKLEGTLNGPGSYDMVAAECVADDRGDILERMENRYNVGVLAS